MPFPEKVKEEGPVYCGAKINVFPWTGTEQMNVSNLISDYVINGCNWLFLERLKPLEWHHS